MRTPIDAERLRGASQASGLGSTNVVARQAGVAHTTVSRVLNGQIRRVNPATLRQLARTLQVPEEWLAGVQKHLPYVPEFQPWEGKRGRKVVSLWERPTQDYVRYSWFMQRVEAAVRRDLDEWFGTRAPAMYDSWGRRLLRVFGVLGSALIWRSATQTPTERGSWAEVLRSEDTPVIAWIEHVLAPWLAGEAYFNAKFFRDLYRAAVVQNPEGLWALEPEDTDAMRALDKYAAKCAQAVQKRLEASYQPDDD